MERRINGTILATAFATALAGSSGAFAAEHNPVGETAHYDIDTDAARTSGLVTGGTVEASITAHVADAGNGANYTMQLAYTFDTAFGAHSGTEIFGVPDAYFTPEFMVALRQSKHYDSPLLKIDYLTSEDATTLDGHTYPACDRIKIYDIKQQAAFLPLVSAAQALLAQVQPNFAGIANMVVVADVYPGIPVISAAKIDVTGKYSGFNVQAGGDYKAP